MEPEGRRAGWAPSLFLLFVGALLVWMVVTTVAYAVAGGDALRFGGGDRPVYGVSSGQNGTDEWLDWDLPAGAGVHVTYEAAGDGARRPATFRFHGTMSSYRAGDSCAARLEWDVSVAGDRAAYGVLHDGDPYLDVDVPLPDAYRGLPIGISLRRADQDTCGVGLRAFEIAIDGAMPYGLLPLSSPQIFIADDCRDDEPCPRP